MSSDKSFVDYIADQMDDAGRITTRKMFGEYGVYCNEKIVALICGNQLFIKQTESGRSFIGNIVEAPPYSGAKLYFLIEDKFEESEWISHLIRITAEELPVPKPKTKRKKSELK
jgi:TfoX/Sxy family transcriptional regulator of competence genes